MHIENIIELINLLPSDSITIVESFQSVQLNPDAVSELVIIPGFSDISFDSNKRVLFANNYRNLNLNKFKRIHMVKFTNNIINNLHLEILKLKQKSDLGLLENQLYKKCGELLLEYFDKSSVYSVLAKSTGAGPAIFMCVTNPKLFTGLNLFAPDVKYIHKTLKTVPAYFPKTVVGWNASDTKVKMVDVWFNLCKVLPEQTVLHSFYYADSSGISDSQNEINTGFFEKII